MIIRQLWRGLLDRIEGFRDGRSETLNGASVEQFIEELNAPLPAVTGQPAQLPPVLVVPGAMASAPAPGRRSSGRHRMPGPVTVTFPAVSAVLPRVTPPCGTRPPWDTAELPVQAASGDEAASPAGPSDASDPGQPDNPDQGQDPDELQEYLDQLPRYPDE
jgi:hypothetical protein